MKVSIIIPVYNEEKTIAQVIKKVIDIRFPLGFTREVIVVNDASTDKSLREISRYRSKITLLNHELNLGKGAAITSALKVVSGDIVLIQDADLEYDPKYYSSLLKPFINNHAQIVYGSRLINYPLTLFGKNKTPLPFHLIANRFLTFLTNILYGVSVTDMETGYKAISVSLLNSLNLKSKRFDFEPEITAKILKRKIPITEVSISVMPRTYDQGKKIGWFDGVMAIWTLIKYRFID